MKDDGGPRQAWVSAITPRGRGAIAVVRVWGRDAVAVVDSAFRAAGGNRLDDIPPGSLRLGRIGEGLGDEVVAVVVPGDLPEVEVQCHGGLAAITLVMEALVAAGAVEATTERWIHQKARTRLHAEAEHDLAQATTLRSAEILLEQAGGALERELTAAISLARAGTDSNMIPVLDRLLDRAEVGLRMVNGWKVVLAGRPNVGKSRLLNSLAGYDRAIVSPSPGTTRDVLSTRIAIDGWPIELIDTAGLRPATDAIEACGIELAQQAHERADLVLLVLDRSDRLSREDADLIDALPNALRVANKIDLVAAWEATGLQAVAVSAVTGAGIEDLAAAISARVVPRPPEPGSGVPHRAPQVEILRRSRQLLLQGRHNEALRLIEELLEPATVGRSW